jgi:hypothetical protein
MVKRLTVLVPKPGSRAADMIDAGSGVVTDEASWTGLPEALVYFEGNRYGAENLRTFDQRVLSAAGRLDQRYPTVAKAMLPIDDFVPVGLFTYTADWTTSALALDPEMDPEILARWLA